MSDTTWARMDVNVPYSSKILEIEMIFGGKCERKVYINQQNFVSDIQLLIKHSFILSFLHELLICNTCITNIIKEHY